MDSANPFVATLEDRFLGAYDASYIANLVSIVWGSFLVFGIAYLIFTGRRVAAPLK